MGRRCSDWVTQLSITGESLSGDFHFDRVISAAKVLLVNKIYFCVIAQFEFILR